MSASKPKQNQSLEKVSPAVNSAQVGHPGVSDSRLGGQLSITDGLHRLANHHLNMSRAEAREVMGQVLRGEASDAQIAAFLVALHMKGETVEEIVGFAEAIRGAAEQMYLDTETLDVSG